MIDLSIVIPAIRTSNWLSLYQSIEKSCTKYSWELILVSPFDLPNELKKYNNIKLINDFGAPTRCLQLGLFEVGGDLMWHTVDDAICFPDAIDDAIDLYKKECGYKDVVNMMYREGENFSGQSMPEGYWWAHFHEPLRLPGIPKHYRLSLHHLLKTSYLVDLGGYDCKFEHANFSLHDLMFRIQADGGTITNAPRDVTTCNHFPANTGDHAPINISHNENDLPYFQKLYSNPNILQERIKIDINNWTQQSSIWTRRFKNIPKSYEDLLKND